MMAMMGQLKKSAGQGDYLLDRTLELERLTLQACAWEPAASAMIARLGVVPGWRCVDLGCGTRGILRPLSHSVAPLGTVIGIDNDPLLLASARKWSQEQGLHNVWLLQDDAFETDLPRGCFDLVHARLLFSQVGRDEQLLREMIALTRPGGLVAVQEPDSASWNCHPRRAGFDALKPAITRAFRTAGGDLDAGTRLFSMLRQAGLEDVQVCAQVLMIPPGEPDRRLPALLATSLRRRIVEGGLLTEAQFDTALADCEAAAQDHNTLFTTPTLVQASGRKPS